MKAILISIRPEWCEKIVNGKKTIEVRKTAPKEVPFKAYIYCTKDKQEAFNNHNGNMFLSPKGWQSYSECNGKVIGEFICDKVYRIEPIFSFYDSYIGYDDSSDFSYFKDYSIDDERLKKTCLTRQELYIYGKEKTLYGWHISDLKIYDKPKELSEFKTGCKGCKERDTYHCKFYCYGERPLTRPPQSYMYVDEVEE